jgi:uncharacterized protein (TIGR02246 family)
MSRALAAIALAGATFAAAAAEVTVIRPTAHVGQEWAYYVLIDGKVLADVKTGERVTVSVPADRRTVVIQCPQGLAGYVESRIDYDFKTNPTAYFLITPKLDCVTIQPLDAKDGKAYLGRTKNRPASRPLEYDPPRQVVAASATGVAATGVAAAAAAAPATSAAPSAASAGIPSAATASTPSGAIAAVAPAAVASAPATNEVSASVAAATAAWVDAFNSRDAARITALYDPEAVLSDATEPKPRTGSAAIADYYKSASQRPTQRVALGERSIRIFGDTAIDSGTYNVFEMRNGNATVTPARYTMVYRQRGGRWLIVDHQAAPAAR